MTNQSSPLSGNPRAFVRRLFWLACLSGACVVASAQPAPVATAETNGVMALTSTNPADIAWAQVEKAQEPPMPPADWQTKEPTEEQQAKFRALAAGMAALGADKARDFYTQFPADKRAADAHATEFDLLQNAVRLGNTNAAVVTRFTTLADARASDPSISEDERFGAYAATVRMALMAKQSEGEAAMVAELEKAGHNIVKRFPNRPDGYQILLEVASDSDPDKARQLAQEIIANPAAAAVKPMAEQLLARLDRIGKPVDLQFTAVDKREVDLGKLKGKVVLVDFWATWCGPCVAELPDVKSAYDKLHAKGFEIIGVSLDNDQSALEKFVKDKDMAWPQYFDGKGWENKFAKQFGIEAIPAMWLLDKKGVLRYTEARDGLPDKIEKLLAE
jgi:thiol-disulfide isomerase/thioredoxin